MREMNSLPILLQLGAFSDMLTSVDDYGSGFAGTGSRPSGRRDLRGVDYYLLEWRYSVLYGRRNAR